MDEREIMKILEKCGAVINGHFQLASGEHSDIYVNKDAVYLDTENLEKLAEEFAKKFVKKNIDMVVGPAVGGAILANRVAYQLTKMGFFKIWFAYADKDNGRFVIRRGYDKIVDERRVLIVEDIINTGTSVAKTAEAVEKAGGRIVSITALFNRGGMTSIGGIRIKSLINKRLKSWKKKDCPLCKKRIPINSNLGHSPK
ncbi:phosphoribosyltransferase [Candidatus Parcubacteria bacterium]|nr:phosphoribosyltransferase [Candidatus Parcubacteria bacterium]